MNYLLQINIETFLLIAAIAAGLLSIIVGAITGTGVLLIPIGIILIIAGIVYNKKKKTEKQ